MARIIRPADFVFAGESIKSGRRYEGQLPLARLVTGTQVSLPFQIYHGRKAGPRVWLSAAIHGDEIAGVEIIRRVAKHLKPRNMSGTVIVTPILNPHGFLSGSRYLPDRRDLNRSFPGSSRGSLGARLAYLIMHEIVANCDVAIDMHTGSGHRTNLPQVRANLEDPATLTLAKAFGAPVMLHAGTRDGSLRQAATEKGVSFLLYEGGEAWRFDEPAIAIGVRGVLRVLHTVGIIEADAAEEALRRSPRSAFATSSKWVRARTSGIARVEVELGDKVERGDQLGLIHDALGARLSKIVATSSGIIIGRIQQPLVNRGDAIVHIAAVEKPGKS